MRKGRGKGERREREGRKKEEGRERMQGRVCTANEVNGRGGKGKGGGREEVK